MSPEVVIVGGGAIGVTAAHQLSLEGAAVTLLERGDTLAFGCSAGNGGLICPSHSLPIATPATLRQGMGSLVRSDGPFALRPAPSGLPWLARFAAACGAERAHRGMRAVRGLSLASLDLHAELADLGTSFERRGTLSVYGTDAAFKAATGELEGSGLRAEVLSSVDVTGLEPALRPPLAGGVFYPDEAHLDPLRYVQAIGEAAVSAGVGIRTGVEVRALRRRKGALTVETSEGELRAATVVLAAGAWTAGLARGLGVFVPLTGGKGYHVDLAARAGDPRVPLWLHEDRLVVTPLPGRLRISGTIELPVLDLKVSKPRVDAIRRAAGRALLGMQGRGDGEVWAGLRPCTPDGLPVIGRPAGAPELILATGHAMKGLSLAPVTARLVADLVAGRDPSHDLEPFGPDRFRPLLRRHPVSGGAGVRAGTG